MMDQNKSAADLRREHSRAGGPQNMGQSGGIGILVVLIVVIVVAVFWALQNSVP